MTLIKTSLLNSVAVIARIFSSLILNKILAVHIGPNGYAAIGQFQNFVNMATTLAGGVVNVGVTKYTAESFDNEAQQIRYWRTAGTTTVLGCALAGTIIAVNGRTFSQLILKTADYSAVFVWLGVTLVLFGLNGLLLAILNGKKDVVRYVAANITGSLGGLLVTGTLAYWGGLYGALVALAINQSIVLLATLLLCFKTPWFRMRYLFGKVDLSALLSLAKYALMALTTAVCVPVSQMLVRNHMASTFGWDAAGHWEALMRISSLYLMVVTTPLAVYYLPRLAEIRDVRELRREIAAGYRLILPLVTLLSVLIYLSRDFIVSVLFTRAFLPMSDLFFWQMIGDAVKIGSWLMGYVLLGRSMTGAFIVTEILFSASWIALVFVFTRRFGTQGAQMAYFVNYCLHWLVMTVLVMRSIGAAEKEPK